MRIVMFYHSLLSDWNHGNAHFLRGITTELLARGHDVRVYEPRNAWSLQNLIAEQGEEPIQRFHAMFPWLRSWRYELGTLDLNQALDAADLVLVHEWNDQALVRRLGEHRAWVGGYRLLFHDTHHRSVTNPESMGAYDLRHYDGVLAFGEVIRDLYLACGIPSLSSPWDDTESLFTPGKDFLVAQNGAEMQSLLQALLQDEAMAHELAEHGRQTILRRHTCAHRVDELLAIYAELEGARAQARETRCAAD